ncbi:hypothetical protein [Halovivax cerinus]|uniref:Uncharacterized protein n=1 Tax=Halovivax cerinus TaxID=1487865 RepID=A0ABD5NRQ9_9EURY|nr:hypothetical protein [Halovivax cerinus]
MTTIDESGTELRIDGETVTLPEPIEDVEEVDDTVVVLFGDGSSEPSDTNVWAFATDGAKLWEIEAATLPTGDAYRYTGIAVEDGALRASNWKGGTYHVDPTDGSIVESELTK